MLMHCDAMPLPADPVRVSVPAPDPGLRLSASSDEVCVMVVFAAAVQLALVLAKSPFAARFGAAPASRPDSSIAAIAIRKRALPATSAADLRMEFLGGLAGMRGCVLVARAA
jgi:hypothetical protein